jgi:PKD domain
VSRAARRAFVAAMTLAALPVMPSGNATAAPPDPAVAAFAPRLLAPRPPVEQAVAEQHAHIAGEPGSNEVDLALRTRLRERAGGTDPAGQPGDTRYTFEAVAPAAGGTAGPDPCAQAGGQLVNVVRSQPDPGGGSTTTPLTACLTRDLVALAAGSPAISAEQAAALLRRVTLPGGTIRVRPEASGLAGLDAQFWVDGAVQPPVELVIGSAVLEARFSISGYRWSFGDGTTVDTTPPGPPDRAGGIRHTYQRGGTYAVAVQVVWSARAFLGDSPLASVDGLVSGSATTYRVDELYAVLTR